MTDDRDERGRFKPGCSPGPGRPRRLTEDCYLTTLADAVPLEDWAAIASKAVTDAKNGDATARGWLSRYLLGDKPGTLLAIAAREATGETVEDAIADAAAERRRRVKMQRYFDRLDHVDSNGDE